LQKRPIISRLLTIIGLFCRISSLFKGSFAKETYNFKEPTQNDFGAVYANGNGVATISRLLKIIGLFAKEPYKRDNVLQKRPIILRSLLIVATPI